MTHLSPGELGDVDAVAGHEHLRSCERCRALWQEQRDVRDLLRSVPQPGPVPTDVAADLAAALARLSSDDVPTEPLLDRAASSASATSATSATTVVPLEPLAARREPGGRPRAWLAAAAAVVLLGGGGAAVVTHPWSGADQSSSTASGAAKESRAAGQDSASRTPVYATGTAYERATLPAQVEQHLLDGTATPLPPSGAAPLASGSSDDRRLASPQVLASCLAALDVDPGHVTAVDLATFGGSPAALVVVRDDAGGQDVWVVGRGCRQGDDQTRYFARVG
ncbi:MAG TPA: hypothetical protein VFL94_05770 [Actinomycetales bacterium]|nr:hypothetical protein [Actinomycetales bacterium]